ncbi:hypothetical protein EXS71_03160 [Candidatus Uhrbacteria bacterium]|nr:hypothetical protein [Candidatus Uhrbacteria bacterium]
MFYLMPNEASPFSRGKIAEILQAIKPHEAPEVSEASRITVHATVSRFAMLYEKMRNAVDYKDDHLLHKAAIVRILKRHLTFESDPNTIALQLIRELIAARYLPNATLPESLTGEVAGVIKKYQAIANRSSSNGSHRAWLMGVIASELEELVDNHTSAKLLVNFLFEQLGDRITLKDQSMDETERRLQVYVACHRSLFKTDDEMMAYKLVRAYHSVWMHPDEWMGDPQAMADKMMDVEQKVRGQLHHALGHKFLHAVKPWAVSLGILRTVLSEKPERAAHLLDHPAELHVAIKRVAERRYKESKGKLRRGTRRAIVYLFITKILIALAIEVPFERLLFKEVSEMSLLINVLFPPVLMLFVGLLIKVPGKDNIDRIQEAVDELLSIEGPSGREMRGPKKQGGFGRFIFSLIYLSMFFVTFGLVYKFLDYLHFTWISSGIFIFFLCVVSFFAFRLRLAAREYIVVERADKLRTILLDFFSLPILRAGQWLSLSISRINIFIFLFDFIIETPFKIFLNILEEWFAFLKEKKDELQ